MDGYNYLTMLKSLSRLHDRLERNLALTAIRQGLVYIIPLVLIGSFGLVFISLPIPAYQRWMEAAFGDQWRNVFIYIRDGTFGIMSLVLLISISYAYAVGHVERTRRSASPMIVAVVSLGSFVAMSGISKESFSIEGFGVIGVFLAIVVAVTSSMLFLKLSSVPFLSIKAFTDGANLVFNNALAAALPAGITVSVYAVINQTLASVWGIADARLFVSGALTDIFANINSPAVSGFLFIFLVHVFWLFGVHGSNVLEPVAQSVFVPKLADNERLLALGQAPTEIFTKTFFDTFVFMGGCGTAMCLVLAILIAGKTKTGKNLAKLSFAPVLFNINELIVFGIPIVLNPIFLVPFLAVPLVMTLNSFLAVYLGWVPHTVHSVEWTTPVFLSGFASTSSLSGSLLQAFNLAVGILIYVPFVRLSEEIAKTQIKKNLNKLYAAFEQGEHRGGMSALLIRHDEVGATARFLAADLKRDLQRTNLSLHYQPQVDHRGRVFGMEALLRWQHDVYGPIYPPLVVALAEEAGLVDKLGHWIVDTACEDLKKMHENGFPRITMSVNVSGMQLESLRFLESLKDLLRKHHIPANAIEIEMTEQIALTSSKQIIQQIKALKQLGVRLAMDDFGMGRSSLVYLKEYDFDTVKLDGSLVREILFNNNCKEIISSIVYLSSSLGFSVVAEFVERPEQRDLLYQIGCGKYQGYLYSKAMPRDELLSYLAAARRRMDAS